MKIFVLCDKVFSMKLHIKADESLLTEENKDLLEKKFAKLDTFLHAVPQELRTANVIIRTGDRFGFEVVFDMDIPGKKHIHAEESHKELLFAITACVNEAKRILRTQKEKADPTK